MKRHESSSQKRDPILVIVSLFVKQIPMKKKIAFISEHASPLATLGGVDSGGQNVYVAELAKHLASAGYQIDIFTRREDQNQPYIAHWLPGIRVIHIEAGPAICIAKEELLQYMPQFTKNMSSFIRTEQINYEVIHANFWMSGLVACDLKEILHIPFVITFHALGYVRKLYQKDVDKFPACRIDVEKHVAANADVIIAECPQDREDLINYYGANAQKITIIPCGFSKKEFYPVDKAEARKKLGLDPDADIILQLGRMVPRKGIDNVIRAAAKLKDNNKPLKLLVVGGDTDIPDPEKSPELKRLMDIARKEDILSSVCFTGRKNRAELKYYYSAADIFITTPWYEPFGITPLESMACGTPVIGSDVGGIKYSVAHGETGFLVQPDNPLALADKIDLLLNDKQLLLSMQRNSIERVNKQFTWARVASMAAALYEQLVAAVPHPAVRHRQQTAA